MTFPTSAVPIDKTFADKVAPLLHRAWGAIAEDSYQLGRVSNRGAMELVLDANRVATFCGDEGIACDKFLSAMFAVHGYGRVYQYLCRNIKLI